MNILIPDSWLREYLKTTATPTDIKRCLSLCGPSVERINTIGQEIVYDIEVTTNRVDMMSVLGIAREAAVILPEFGFAAEILPPKLFDLNHDIASDINKLDIVIQNNVKLCKRILAIKLTGLNVEKSDAFISQKLDLVGQRPLNNLIDITNFVMWEIGHPIHAFDYDRLTEKTIIVRLGKNGEKLTTLDDKTHILHGGEIVFDDGQGEIIDLPGIMGTKNTVVTSNTKNVLLFIENSDAVKIRYASMGLSIRSQAAVLNEKSPDPETAEKTLARAIYLYQKYTHAKIDSKLFDTYPGKTNPVGVSVLGSQINSYIGEIVPKSRVINILTKLGFSTETTDKPELKYTATPPSYRSEDIKISVDIIEEIARIYGYHNIKPVIAGGNLLPTQISPVLTAESEIKTRIRDFGYTELYSYSMLSIKDIETFYFPKDQLYEIANPLSNDLVYLRPSLIPGMLTAIKNNINRSLNLMLFELSNIYKFQNNNLPLEVPYLCICRTGDHFDKIKGITEVIFQIMGIPFPKTYKPDESDIYESGGSLNLENYGSLGIINTRYLNGYGINQKVVLAYLNFNELVIHSNPQRSYKPISKYPQVYEDLSFNFQTSSKIGLFIDKLISISSLISSIKLIDSYGSFRTLRFTYVDPTKNLTAADIKPIRENVIMTAKNEFNADLKSK
jgi:phenylalanyl-tRNA synthetase beta chain